MNREDLDHLNTHSKNVNHKSRMILLVVITSFFLVFLLIGNLLSTESAKQSFTTRFYSRSLLQIANALVEANHNIEKYLATRTPIYLDDAVTKLSSAQALVTTFLGASSVEELPVEFINNYHKVASDVDELLTNIDYLSEASIEEAMLTSKLLLIQSKIRNTTAFTLGTEGAAWRLRLTDFSQVISSEKFNKISLNILSVFIFILLFVLINFIMKKKKYDKALEESRIHFLNTARLMSLGEFSSTVAHEINNPLSIIIWRVAHVEKIFANQDSSSDLVKSVISIKDQAARIDKIIRGIKLLSTNANSLEREVVNVKDLIHDFSQLVEHRMNHENITLQTDFEKLPSAYVYVRPVQLIQVLMNFFNNSVEAIATHEKKWIKLEIVQDKRFVKIIFRDSGLTEDIENKEKIFDLFYTSKKSKGTGLGLGVSRQIIESYEGELVLNDKSTNTEFVITLLTFEKGKNL